jgi:hypothetical protein
MRALALTILCLCLAQHSLAGDLKSFTTDGCSLWIDGTHEQPNLWRHCCVAHDLAYWQGGSKAQRKQADDDILTCVKQAQGPGMANYIYANVRWGGSPYWMSSYRWGYGWDYLDGIWPRGYKEPDAKEQAQIVKQMPAALETVARDTELYPVSSDKAVIPAPTH